MTFLLLLQCRGDIRQRRQKSMKVALEMVNRNRRLIFDTADNALLQYFQLVSRRMVHTTMLQKPEVGKFVNIWRVSYTKETTDGIDF